MPTLVLVGTADIAAAPAYVLAVAADCARYPEFLPGCLSATRLSLPAEVGTEEGVSPLGPVYRVVVQGLLRVVVDVRVTVDSSGGMTLTRLEGPLIPALMLRLRAVGNEPHTRLDYTLEIEFLGQLPARALTHLEKVVVPRWLNALATRVTGLLGGAGAPTAQKDLHADTLQTSTGKQGSCL